ncbi:hypothetical protein LUZ60_001582 [Juncus effusus]|nr:hypothetical protein LUZ60_001582 [Juncus effusus]
MLCVKTESSVVASASSFLTISNHQDMFASSNNHAPFLPASLGSQIQKAMQKVGGKRSSGSRKSSDQMSDTASCSGIEDDKRSEGTRSEGRSKSKTQKNHRFQLEQEVKKLQRQLQEEIDLHLALANAVAHDSIPSLKSPAKIPYKTQELLVTIASLETSVSKLEKELDSLQYRLCHERNERLLAESHIGGFTRSVSSAPTSSASRSTWEESISSLRDLKFGGSNLAELVKQDDSLSEFRGHHKASSSLSMFDGSQDGEMPVGSVVDNEENNNKIGSLAFDQISDLSDLKRLNTINLWTNPNQLSEEMVRCMRNIFLCLSESSKAGGQVSLSDLMPSQDNNNNNNNKEGDRNKSFDPYRVNIKGNLRDIGNYAYGNEVSWMSVGKEQLDYASDALKKFRSLVEQLGKVNPAIMCGDEKLAFWINLYNALIMHAYLAYGVPKNDIKLFSLMQKACYTIGGLSISAAEIEFVILKAKPPVHRPQLALMLALQKFKITEEHKSFSIENSEPMILFALSNGVFSSPAVRIFSAENVRVELQSSMRDYIRASVGVSEKGKLMVPKLLHGFAKGIVEDSLLVDWICHHLSPDQINAIKESASQKKQRLLGARSFTVVNYDTKFRYIFLPDNNNANNNSKVVNDDGGNKGSVSQRPCSDF